ncbi:MAG TPA: hypothetical protein VLI67_04420 [Vicinamibacteria bacterium]|nr:hypothetical protein [Vicinamibacteria bacterium]
MMETLVLRDLDAADLSRRYEKVLEQLRQGDFRSAEVKRLERTLASFPDRVLPPRRKQRAYVSSVLAKNEAFGTNPYNRHLFLRVAHGLYVLNPALEVEVKGAWAGVGDLMGLPLLLDSLAPSGRTAYLRRWMERGRDQVAARFRGGADEPVGEPLQAAPDRSSGRSAGAPRPREAPQR